MADASRISALLHEAAETHHVVYRPAGLVERFAAD
jgi:hypothetical protein